jgi:hypothetical protein
LFSSALGEKVPDKLFNKIPSNTSNWNAENEGLEINIWHGIFISFFIGWFVADVLGMIRSYYGTQQVILQFLYISPVVEGRSVISPTANNLCVGKSKT